MYYLIIMKEIIVFVFWDKHLLCLSLDTLCFSKPRSAFLFCCLFAFGWCSETSRCHKTLSFRLFALRDNTMPIFFLRENGYENGCRRLLGAQSINTERASYFSNLPGECHKDGSSFARRLNVPCTRHGTWLETSGPSVEAGRSRLGSYRGWWIQSVWTLLWYAAKVDPGPGVRCDLRESGASSATRDRA